MGLTLAWRSPVVAVGAALLVCACGSQRTDDRGASQVATDAMVLTAQADSVSVFGVSISGDGITFDEDRRVMSAARLWRGAGTGKASTPPPASADKNKPPKAFDIAADEEMQFSGNVTPSCPAEGGEPVALDVTSTTGDGPS